MKTLLLALTLRLQHPAVVLEDERFGGIGSDAGALAGEGFRVVDYVTYGCVVVFLLSLLTYEQLRPPDASR